jgi:23S rRNA pseudouridine2605 synthase
MGKPRTKTIRDAASNNAPGDNGSDGGDGERLQKVLAAAGLGSRRRCEELILEGRVEVDGQVVRKLGTRVDAQQSRIEVDGEPIRAQKKLYFALHKPRGVLSTNSDPSGRARVVDLIPGQERLFAVGRLDQASEGLILVTNDGELAQRLTHPRFGVEKIYQVQVAGVPTPETLATVRRGVYLAEGFARVVRVKLKSTHKQSAILEMVLDEGKNREVRRLFAKVGHKVMRLRRVAVGPIKLGNLGPGEFRPLTSAEIKSLRSNTPAAPAARTGPAARTRKRPASPSKLSKPRRRKKAAASGRRAGPAASRGPGRSKRQ